MAARVERTASPISPQRNSRQRHLVLGLSFINQTVAVPSVSLRGLGAKFRERSVSGGAERSASSSFIQRCWACKLILTSPERAGFPVTPLTLSRWEKLTMKSKTQTATRAVQVRRQGQISSRNESLMAFASVAANVNSRTGCFRRLTSAATSTTSRRMASSFGAAERCRASKISRGVFMPLFWQGASLRARRHWRADERRAEDCPPYLCVFAP